VAKANAGKLELTIDLKGVDKTGATINKTQKNLDGMGNKARKAGKDLDGVGKSMGGLSGKIAQFIPGGKETMGALKGFGKGGGLASAGFLKLAGGVTAAVGALMAFKGQAMEASTLEFRLSRLGESYFEASQMVEKLKRESQGVYSTKQIVDLLTLQKEYGIDLKLTGEDLSKLDDRFTAMGLSASSGFRQIAEAVKAGRQQQLQKLGIVDNLTDSYKAQAAAIGISVAALTEEQKLQIRIAEVKRGISEIEKGGITGEITAFERMEASMANMGQSIGDMLGPVFQGLSPWVEAVDELLQGLAPVVSLLLRVVQGVLQPAGEIVRGVFDSINVILIPTIRAFDQAMGAVVQKSADGWRKLMGMLAAGMETVLRHTVKWLRTAGSLLERMGLLDKGTTARVENTIRIARAEAESAKELKSQEASQEELLKMKQSAQTVMDSSASVINQTEANLLKMVQSTRDLTSQEEGRLRFLEGILKTEQATAKIKRESVKLVKVQTEMISAQLDMMASGEAFTTAGAQKWLALGDEIKSVTNRIEYLAHLEVKSADTIRDTIGKGKKKARGPGAPTPRAEDPEAQARAAAADRLSEQRGRLKLDRMEMEIIKMQTLDELKLISINTEMELLQVQDLRLQGNIAQADLLERRILLQDEMNRKNYEAAQANAALAESSRQLSQGIGAVTSASMRAEGKTKAMGLTAAATAQLTDNLVNKEKSLQESLLATSGPLSNAAQAFAEEEANKAKIAGAMELAFAAAAFAVPNPIAGVAHLAAAALFFKVAASAGAATAAPQRQSARLPQQQGPSERQIVINFNSIQTDPQSTARQISQVLESQRGTGAA